MFHRSPDPRTHALPYKNERYLKVEKAVSSTSSMSVFQRYFNVVENETRVSST
jgi:hypothetical protein